MAEPVATLTEADDGKAVDLRVGERVTLHLYENAATGYRWAFDALDAKAIGVHDEGPVRRPEAVGSGGGAQWTLEAKAPGTAEVRLKLWRAWEGDASVQKRFTLTLRIRQ